MINQAFCEHINHAIKSYTTWDASYSCFSLRLLQETLLWEERGLPPLHGLKLGLNLGCRWGSPPSSRSFHFGFLFRSRYSNIFLKVMPFAYVSSHSVDSPLFEAVVTALFQDVRYFLLSPLRRGSSPNPLQVRDALDARGISSLPWFWVSPPVSACSLPSLVARGVDFSVDAVGPEFGFPVRGRMDP